MYSPVRGLTISVQQTEKEKPALHAGCKAGRSHSLYLVKVFTTGIRKSQIPAVQFFNTNYDLRPKKDSHNPGATPKIGDSNHELKSVLTIPKSQNQSGTI